MFYWTATWTFFNYNYIYSCVCSYMHTTVHLVEVKGTTFMSWFSPSTMWVLKT